MSFASILYSIIILPIESIIEFVFCFTIDKFDKFGVAGAIIAVSLAVNFLALPIYNVADKIQLKERELQNKMRRWVSHIRKHFKGDEQFMMLSAYYRENNYHPLYALRQSLSIIIEVPFFIAAYHFLSHCPLLENQSILFLKDLSKPDALIHLSGGGINNSGITLNLLPILMTVINIASSIIYTKGAPLREKIQTFALAGIFLVLLYNSPSGLVFYWILNNLFSLIKNLVNTTKYPNRIWHVALSLFFVTASGYLLFFKPNKFSSTKCVFYFFTAVFIAIPFIWKYLKSKKIFNETVLPKHINSDKNGFVELLLSCLCLALLCGLLLPSSVVATSPAEFSFLGNTDSPLTYVWSALAYFTGLFVFWPVVIYKLFDENKTVKKLMSPLFFVLAVCALANAFLFKHEYGVLSTTFTFNSSDVFVNNSLFFLIMPFLFALFAFVLYFVLSSKFKHNYAFIVIGIVLVSQLLLIFGNVKRFNNNKNLNAFVNYKNDNGLLDDNGNIIPQFHLSKKDRNVVVVFLDRAVATLFPYILEEFPSLKDDFDGFVNYPNCLSFGAWSVLGQGPLLGGYEYSVESMNKRSDKTIGEKYKEAAMLLPKLFSDAGFEVTAADIPDFDMTTLDNMPNVQSKKIYYKLTDKYIREEAIELGTRSDIVCNQKIKKFCLLEIMFPCIRKKFYNNGQYFSLNLEKNSKYFGNLIPSYAGLFYLSDLTTFDSEKDTYTFFYNALPHYDDNFTLVGKDYHPGFAINGENEYKTGVYNTNGVVSQITAYQVNAASILLLSKWMKFLKKNNCYDNTRIIIVADHGAFEEFEEFRKFEDCIWYDRKASYNCMLLYKDFFSHGEPVSEYNFMTNAETPNLAVKDLNVSDINPYTGNPLQHITDFSSIILINAGRVDQPWNPNHWSEKVTFEENGVFYWRVHDNIFDESNWKKVDALEAEK